MLNHRNLNNKKINIIYFRGQISNHQVYILKIRLPTATQILQSFLEFQIHQKCSRGFITEFIMQQKKTQLEFTNTNSFPLHICRKTSYIPSLPISPSQQVSRKASHHFLIPQPMISQIWTSEHLHLLPLFSALFHVSLPHHRWLL